MKASDSRSKRSPSLRRLAGVLALGAIFVGPGLAGVDETLGGLPGNDDGDGIPGNLDRRPSFFVQGTYTEVESVVVQDQGAIPPELVEVEPGIVRKIFHGDHELVLDEYIFHTTNVTMGVLCSSISGLTKYMLSWDGGHTQILSVPEGSVIELPFGRIRSSGMLDAPAKLTAWNSRHGRSIFAMQRLAGQIRIQIQH
jgi:hypothetical protein